MPNVAIVGCGWFGFPLAKSLVTQGFKVCGSKRELSAIDSLTDAGIVGFQLDLDDTRAGVLPAVFFESDSLVVNVPPALKRGNRLYIQRLTNLIELLQGKVFKRIIFVSTTGVYPSEGTEVFEQDATAYSEDSALLLAAEQLLVNYGATCVVRFAGLVGPKRHPGRFLAGKVDIAGASNAVNLVHLDDCIDGVIAVIKADKVSPIYNLCAPDHPTKAAFYSQACSALGLVVPEFSDITSPNKIVNGDHICQSLAFNYRHPKLTSMLEHC